VTFGNIAPASLRPDRLTASCADPMVASSMRSRSLAVLFAAVIFVSAFLLFQIQPLISKCLLPWFGGTPNVWTTCLLFFQSALFGGYLYAHVLSQRLQPAWQALTHLLLLCLAVALLKILPGEEFKPGGDEAPVPLILAALAVSVGLPYFLLSATGPLLQNWYARILPGSSPYRLYALSNAGSLLALVSYPFLFEPMIGMGRQADWWSAGFCAFALLCGTCAVCVAWSKLSRSESTPALQPTSTPNPVRSGSAWRWFGLSMLASVMLLATTNQICLDVAVVPFLWVAPLSLYLLTFILCFDSDRWYSRTICGLAGAFTLVLTTFLMLQSAGVSLVVQAGVAFAAMFLCCMVCHGELVRLRPGPERLTKFYLTISAGGAAGGLFVAVIAPLVFPLYLEMHLSIALCCVLTLLVFLREKTERDGRSPLLFRAATAIVTLVVAAALGLQAAGVVQGSAEVKRNFYGVLRVEHQLTDDPDQHTLNLRYGRILHGVQFQSADKREIPTTYFGHDSGVGRVLLASRDRRSSLRVGIVGLGVGTLAAYGREGDRYRFYEINPDVLHLADRHFTFLSDCDATIEIVPGDARLSLEREPRQQYDVLVLDAFSGDAVPAHLLTREAMSVYAKQLAPHGVLAIHISNLHFDLSPVAAALVESQDFHFRLLRGTGDHDTAQTSSLWLAASRDESLLNAPEVAQITVAAPESRVLWTDDFSNLYEVLR
jgi:hypothetical protein